MGGGGGHVPTNIILPVDCHHHFFKTIAKIGLTCKAYNTKEKHLQSVFLRNPFISPNRKYIRAGHIGLNFKPRHTHI